MNILEEIADELGGEITEVILLPDESGMAMLSMPLPKDHWLTADGFNEPPMPFRLGTNNENHRWIAEAIRAAGRYAIRSSTMNGKEEDFDPDAMLQNLVVGMIGYWTHDGLESGSIDFVDEET